MTVISTLQQLILPGAATVQGHALLLGEERKLSAHAEACRSVGVSFIPLVVQSLGGWSDEAADTISSIGHFMGQRLGISPVESTCHLFHRCAISLWRGNAPLWIRWCPIRAPSVDGVFTFCSVCVLFVFVYFPICIALVLLFLFFVHLFFSLCIALVILFLFLACPCFYVLCIFVTLFYFSLGRFCLYFFIFFLHVGPAVQGFGIN